MNLKAGMIIQLLAAFALQAAHAEPIEAHIDAQRVGRALNLVLVITNRTHRSICYVLSKAVVLAIGTGGDEYDFVQSDETRRDSPEPIQIIAADGYPHHFELENLQALTLQDNANSVGMDVQLYDCQGFVTDANYGKHIVYKRKLSAPITR